MPHVIIYTTFEDLAKGPTYVANDDTILMDYLGGQPPTRSGGSALVNESPTQVLDKLEQRGYKVVGMSSTTNADGISSYVWTLQKPEEIEPFA